MLCSAFVRMPHARCVRAFDLPILYTYFNRRSSSADAERFRASVLILSLDCVLHELTKCIFYYSSLSLSFSLWIFGARIIAGEIYDAVNKPLLSR